MARDEQQTRIELINPALHERGWVDSLIREEKMIKDGEDSAKGCMCKLCSNAWLRWV
jgi:type I site-specific restriction endonuclease